MSLAYFLLLALLPLAAYSMALTRKGRAWHTRHVPADAFSLATCIAVAGWVDLSFGILAALSVGWWVWKGWERRPGATLWLSVAGAVWMGRAAPPELIHAALSLVLAVGVIESLVMLGQWLDVPIPIMKAPKDHLAGRVVGNIGHRTGAAVYIAVLVPLAFLTDYWWLLVPVYGLGLVLAPAFDAALAMTAGLLIVAPSSWWVVFLIGMGLWTLRVLMCRTAGEPMWQTFGRFSPRHMDTWKTRRIIWRTTARRLRRWPAWLVGYGAGSFQMHARTWRRSTRLKEVFNEAHNDWLELSYEYGLLGMAAIGFWIWRMPWATGDPITGSAGALGVAMLGNFPIRVAPIAAVGLLLAIVMMRRVA